MDFIKKLLSKETEDITKENIKKQRPKGMPRWQWHEKMRKQMYEKLEKRGYDETMLQHLDGHELEKELREGGRPKNLGKIEDLEQIQDIQKKTCLRLIALQFVRYAVERAFFLTSEENKNELKALGLEDENSPSVVFELMVAFFFTCWNVALSEKSLEEDMKKKLYDEMFTVFAEYLKNLGGESEKDSCKPLKVFDKRDQVELLHMLGKRFLEYVDAVQGKLGPQLEPYWTMYKNLNNEKVAEAENSIGVLMLMSEIKHCRESAEKIIKIMLKTLNR